MLVSDPRIISDRMVIASLVFFIKFAFGQGMSFMYIYCVNLQFISALNSGVLRETIVSFLSRLSFEYVLFLGRLVWLFLVVCGVDFLKIFSRVNLFFKWVGGWDGFVVELFDGFCLLGICVFSDL